MLALIIVLVTVFLDQISKHFVVLYLKGQRPLTIIEGLLSFTYVENRGAAFGILQNRKLFFVAVTVVTLIILMYIFLRYYKYLNLWTISSLSMIMGGTIGNFIDRMSLDYVVDFISLRFFNRYNFAVFNLADTFIVVGAIMLMLYIMIFEPKKVAKSDKI